MPKIKILHTPSEKEPFLIILKPKHLPSAPLRPDDESAFSQAAELFPNLIKVKGRKEIEHGLMHRLDTETSGLLLIAGSQNFYDLMQIEQNEGRFIKKYTAICNCIPDNAELLKGFPVLNDELCSKIKRLYSVLNDDTVLHNSGNINNTFTLSSFFRNFGEGVKSVRPVSENSGMAALKKCKNRKLYTTDISFVKPYSEKNAYIFECSISNGYRHQVRSHLAWAGFPCIGDDLYNSQNNKNNTLKFYATEIHFTNPVNGEKYFYKLELKDFEDL